MGWAVVVFWLTSHPRTATSPYFSLTLGSAPPSLMAATSAPLGGRMVSRNSTSCCFTCTGWEEGGSGPLVGRMVSRNSTSCCFTGLQGEEEGGQGHWV